MKNKKSLGQNWLKDRATLETIAELACDLPEESLEGGIKLCLEIGPGLGTLTSSLLRRFDKVIAVEYDRQLATNLPKSFPGKQLEVVNADFLEFNFDSIKEPYVVAGNIPYYITTPIIEKLLTTQNRPARIVLLVQKEVAEKICPKDPRRDNSSLSLFVDNYAEANLGPIVTRELFTPPPKVDSRVLVITPRNEPIADNDILDFIHKSFIAPRKKLSANLSCFTNLSKQQIEEVFTKLHFSVNVRPAELNLQDYMLLAKTIKKR